nr:MAG TPA: peptidase [Bacteriophage sp.]
MANISKYFCKPIQLLPFSSIDPSINMRYNKI